MSRDTNDARELIAQCPCGHTITINGNDDGQTLYGALGYKMARHEPCDALSHQSPWKYDHPHSVPDDPMGEM